MLKLTHCYVLLVGCCLSGCATYQARELPNKPSLPDTIPHLFVAQQSLSPAFTHHHEFDPSGALDMDGAAVIAVLNNPDLKLARAEAGVARAQAFAAGLLPDPQLSLAGDLSNSGGSGSSKAFSTGLSMDILALLTYHANDAAAQAEIKKTDLNLLWQEWQVAAQARLLYIRITFARKSQALLALNRALFATRAGNSQKAYANNLISSDAALPDLSALQDIQKQNSDLERQINQLLHDFNQLLGLAPDATVQLLDSTPPADLDDAAIIDSIAHLPQRRPDLLALQSGFAAQDQRYRAALLAQFPALNIGFTHARDSSGIYSNGLGVTLSLPLFNRNRGNVAIEQTTRDKLIEDYQLRLDSANSDIHKILAEQHINARQLDELQTTLQQFSALTESADAAYQKNIVDALIYTNAHTALLAKQLEEINLQQAMQEQRVALQTLIGGDLPVQPEMKKNGS